MLEGLIFFLHLQSTDYRFSRDKRLRSDYSNPNRWNLFFMNELLILKVRGVSEIDSLSSNGKFNVRTSCRIIHSMILAITLKVAVGRIISLFSKIFSYKLINVRSRFSVCHEYPFNSAGDVLYSDTKRRYSFLYLGFFFLGW